MEFCKNAEICNDMEQLTQYEVILQDTCGVSDKTGSGACSLRILSNAKCIVQKQRCHDCSTRKSIVTCPWRDVRQPRRGFVVIGLAMGDILPSPDSVLMTTALRDLQRHSKSSKKKVTSRYTAENSGRIMLSLRAHIEQL